MNILVFTHRPILPPYSGYSRLIYDTYIELAKMGNNIDIITILPRSTYKEWCAPRISFKNIIVNELNPIFRRLLIPRLLLRVFHESALFIHLERITKLYAIEPMVNKVISLIKTGNINKPDIIVSETIYPALLANKIARRLGIPCVVRAHNVDSLYISSISGLLREISLNRMIKLEKAVLKTANCIITIAFQDKFIIKKLYNIEAIHIPPVIRINEHANFDILNKFGIEPYKYLLYVASDHKPNREYLKYIAKISNIARRYGLHTIIAGTISKYARKYANKVKILGILSPTELGSLMKHAFLFFAPHHGNGVSIKLVEALQYRLPIITTYNSLRTLKGLKNYENIIAIRDLKHLGKITEELILDTKLYNKIKEGVNRYYKNIYYKFVTKKYYKVLDEMCLKT